METETKLTRYISRFREHRIVMKPSHTKEVDGRVVTYPGESVRFTEGMFETSDPQVIAFLDGQKDFGRTFYKVPDNVKDVVAHRENSLKDLETRERDVAEREKAVLERESRVGMAEEGSRTSTSQGVKEDDLNAMNRVDLIKVAQELGIDSKEYKVGTSNDSIRNAIRAKRAASAPAAPAGSAEGSERPAF